MGARTNQGLTPVGELLGDPPPELSELIAKVRAWHEGAWDGVACDQCGEKVPLPFERGAFSLCYKCDGIRAVLEQRYKNEQTEATDGR